MFLSCDMETYSRVDLKKQGLHNYATDPSTGIHCMSWGSSQDNIGTWLEGDPFPSELVDHLKAGGIFTAWNAAFEIALWNECATKRYGWPVLPIEQVRCSMAQSYAMALPGSLEAAAPALGVAMRKDPIGKRVMLQLCQAKPDGSMWRPEHDLAKFEKLYEYNRQDVRTELALRERLMDLSDAEQTLWVLDQKVNSAGILVDLQAIDKAITLVASEKKRLDAQMLKTTGGVVGSCTEVQLLVKWIRSQGVEIPGVAKSDVLDALGGDLPANVRKALELRKEAAKSSTAKLIAMKERASKDGRVRGCHQFHGASTGRWAGRGIQIQNLPRSRPDMGPAQIEDVFAHLHDRSYLDVFYGPVMDALADSVRGFIVAAPGHRLIVADWSNIEGRVGAWLADETWKLEAFRAFDAGTGPDIYKLAYARSFNKPVSEVAKDERTIGKVMELALQYSGGVGAFQSMARVYGVKVPDERADQLKVLWREAHPAITRYWYQVERAAFAALTDGGVQVAGRVAFKKDGSFLWCRLPSGRLLCYPYPKIEDRPTRWGTVKPMLVYSSVDSLTNKWEETPTYHGKLFENLCQAVARDILAEGLTRLDAAGYKITFHVHDEVISEMPDDTGSLREMERLMCVLPPWADGLPVAAAGFESRRYRK